MAANEIDVESGNTLYLQPKDDKKRWYTESGKIIL